MNLYAGDVIFRSVRGRVVEEPLTRLTDLYDGLHIWVPTPSGATYCATVHWDANVGYYWRCGQVVGWLAFGEDERRCWVCTGASSLSPDD